MLNIKYRTNGVFTRFVHVLTILSGMRADKVFYAV